MIPKSGNYPSQKIIRNNRLERQFDSIGLYPALVYGRLGHSPESHCEMPDNQNMKSAAPTLAEIARLFDDLPGPDVEAAEATRAREAELLKPPGALGRLERICEWLSAWQGRHPPGAERLMVAVFAGNHGVVAQGVAPYPQRVTAQMVESFRHGGAAINQLCLSVGAGLQVFDLALEQPTADITEAPAMSETDCAAAFLYGREAIAEAPDIVCLGEMGIGNTTVASALVMALHGGRAADWVGPGTGSHGGMLARKTAAVEKAVALHAGHPPLELLRRLGGREFAAIAGAIVAARFERVPVILDGFCACAAAAVVKALAPGGVEHCLAGHVGGEPAHRRLLEILGLEPLLDLGMRLGEASGATLALGVVAAAARTHAGMATFAEAGVSGRA